MTTASLEEDTERTSHLEYALTGMQQVIAKAKDQDISSAAKAYLPIIKMNLAPNRLGLAIDTAFNEVTEDSLFDIMYLNLESSLESNANHSEIIDWILAYTQDNPEKFNNAYQHVKQNPDNLAWLLIALDTIQTGSAAQQSEILTLAKHIKPSQSGFYSVRKALLLAIEKLEPQNKSQQKALIKDTLALIPAGKNYKVSEFFYGRASLFDTNVDSFVAHSFFYPSSQLLAIYPASQTQYVNNRSFPLFDQILNNLPLSALVKVAESKNLPKNVAPKLYASIWTKAMLLQNYKLAADITDKVAELNPSLAPIVLQAKKAKVDDEKQIQLTKALMDFSSLSPVITTKNAWYIEYIDFDNNFFTVEPTHVDYSKANWCDALNTNINNNLELHVAFLNSQQIKEYQKETEKIQAIPGKPLWAAQTTIKLATAHSKDVRLAELLSKAIGYTSSQTCYSSTWGASKTAFMTLNKLFPKNEWTKKTKYYY